jgi:ubiquinone/menaquinone biosynthesis C-methylase UbiE
MNKLNTNNEFNNIRSKLYEEAISEYPLARNQDILSMQKYLQPKKGDYVLGIGEGNGYFCNEIAKAIGKVGKYTISDPSPQQLKNIRNREIHSRLEIIAASAEEIPLRPNQYNKVWSFGAFHHCHNQTEAMKRIYQSLKPEGKLVICDVFQGSKLAKHFDTQVARYCCTGHEVQFLSEEFAKTLCNIAGFDAEKIKIIDLPQKWSFNTEYDLGKFIYKLHAMTLIPGTEDQKIKQTLKGCKKILGIEYNSTSKKYELNWPMKALIAKK